METLSLDELGRELQEDIFREALASSEPQQAVFFERFASLAAVNGDCPDLEYTPARQEGTRPWQVDGFAIDHEQAELCLAICDFRASEEVESLVQSQIDASFRRLERFYELAQRDEFIRSLEETGFGFQCAFPIHEAANQIRRVRLFLFTNARLAARKKSIESREIAGRTLTYNLLDITRYSEIESSRGGLEDFEVDIREMNDGKPVPCLMAGKTGDDAKSYLLVLPGELLAKIHGTYGARLLEQNVRTFLQAKTKVNRGIIDTIKDAPEMFFAYNNGLTMTAADLEFDDGGGAITSLRSPQIVNGGQTTASIRYAKEQLKADLSRVFVQAKLTVVDREAIEKVVPKISRYANTQNRVSEADLFSTHPFHVWMESVAKRMSAPRRAGQFTSSKWFYERARGQFLNEQAYKSKSDRTKFLAEYPKEQLVDKPLLAKAMLILDCEPVTVSKGAQYAFMRFAEQVVQQWDKDKDQFHDDFFRGAIGKVICFRTADRLVSQASWYQADRGHKANIVTYTLGWLVHHIRNEFKAEIDFQKIWNRQAVTDELEEAIARCAPIVARTVKDPPANVKNVSEYAKRSICWDSVKALRIELSEDLHSSLIGLATVKSRAREAKALKSIDNGIELDARLLKLTANPELVNRLVQFARDERMLSPTLDSGRRKLSRGQYSLTPAERDIWGELLARAESSGLEID